jgi:hypothetical protein
VPLVETRSNSQPSKITRQSNGASKYNFASASWSKIIRNRIYLSYLYAWCNDAISKYTNTVDAFKRICINIDTLLVCGESG